MAATDTFSIKLSIFNKSLVRSEKLEPNFFFYHVSKMLNWHDSEFKNLTFTVK